ncbi:hypothetical protein FQN49_008393, partial [Arthroderma sp. PD_2]
NAGLQTKLESTESKPEFVMEDTHVEKSEPKEATVDKAEEPVEEPKTNGATIAAALGAAVVIPGAAVLAAQAVKSGDNAPTANERSIPEKDVAETPKHTNGATVPEQISSAVPPPLQDQSKTDVKDESCKDIEPHAAPEESAVESNKAVTTENLAAPEPQAEETPVTKGVQEPAAIVSESNPTPSAPVDEVAAIDKDTKKDTPEASDSVPKSTEEPASNSTAADASAVKATTNGTKTNGAKTNGASGEPRPTTANQSVSSFTAHRRDNFLKALWRAIFVNFFGSIFGFRRRETAA